MSGIWIGVRGELLNSKSEWHQAKVVRTRTKDVQGGVELVQHQAVGGSQGESRGRTLGWGVGARTQGQWDSFSKSKSSIVVLSHPFCFWQGTGHNPVFQNFCQLKWPGQQGSLDLFRKCIRFRGTTLFLRQSLLNSIFNQGNLYFRQFYSRQSLLKAIFTQCNLHSRQSLLKEIFTPMTAGGQFISWRFIGTMYLKMGLICQLSQNLLCPYIGVERKLPIQEMKLFSPGEPWRKVKREVGVKIFS